MMKKWIVPIILFGFILSIFLPIVHNVWGADSYDSRYVWKEHLNTRKFGERGIANVIDGDTIDIGGVGRVRLADINAPERDEPCGEEAKEYVKSICEEKKVYLDIDDLYITGGCGRIVAVVYAPYRGGYVNLNQLLLKKGYAKASDYQNEFDPYIWLNSPLEVVKIT
jgi:micrococcal nuclease